MTEEFLPVGSVVLLKNATRPVAIIGYTVVEEKEDEIWDYLGCVYPFGVMGQDKNLLFQREQIEKIIFKGYSDKEGNNFREKLKESVENIKDE